MKKIILIVVIASVLTSCDNSQFKKSISDDGKTMRIEVKVNTDEQKINYHKSFDVSNMSAEQRKELQHHIFDSLGVSDKR